MTSGNAWLGRGQPSSSVLMEMDIEMDVSIRLLDQIWGPPSGCISAMRRVAMFRAVIERQSGVPFLRVSNAISRGQSSKWDEERLREVFAMTSSASWSLEIRV